MRSCGRSLLYLSAFILFTALTGCSSGSGSTGSGGGSNPDFSISVSPNALTLTAGTSSSFQVSLSPIDGFSGSATVSVSGLPTGVTIQPASGFSVSASSPQTVTVNIASSVTAGNYSIQVSASSGSLSHSGTVGVTVTVPVNPDFALTVNPASLSIVSGSGASFNVSIQGSGGFSGGVQIQISGLPTGSTISPAGSFTLYPAQSQTVTLGTADSLSQGSYNLTVAGSSGTLSHSGTESVTVESSQAPPSRADFVRTDDTPGGIVYDQLHQRVYETNPIAGTVDAISTVTHQILRRIPVPSPAGIDISPDDSTVFIGTTTQAVYAMDTATMALTARYVAPLGHTAGNASVVTAEPPSAPVAAPDGTVLISEVNVSGGGQIMDWNPTTGTTTTVNANPPTGFIYGAANGVMGPSADHTKVILSNDQNPSTVYVYDEATNTFSAPLSVDGYVFSVAVNPAGTQFAMAEFTNALVFQTVLLDANLNTIATIPGAGNVLYNVLYSADGKYLYESVDYGQYGFPLILLINTTTFEVAGLSPLYTSEEALRSPSGQSAIPLATDRTGLVFGSADHGLSIDDTTDLRNYTANPGYPTNDFSLVPNAGPVGQTQSVQVETASYPSVPQVWFGPVAGSSAVGGSYLEATAPAFGQTGPVNVRINGTINGTDIAQAWMPNAYTYGAMLSPGPDLAAPAAGGVVATLYGYGLGNNSASPGSWASETTATLGGQSATISSGLLYTGTGGYPFPLWDLTAKVPATTPGDGDINVTTPWGTSTLHNVYHALDMPSYALDGTPYSMLYDPTRQQLYIAVTDHVDVFSLANDSFASTIQVPTLNGLKQLGGMALTPDGSKLLVANWGDGSVAVIDPDNPSTATAVAVGVPPSQSPWDQGPNQLAATNTGLVFVGVGGEPFTMAPTLKNTDARQLMRPGSPRRFTTPSQQEAGVWTIDLNSMSATAYPPMANFAAAPAISASSDGSEVCFTGGYVGFALYNSATTDLTQGDMYASRASCAVTGSEAASASADNGFGAVIDNLDGEELTNTNLTDYEQSALGTLPEIQGVALDTTGALLYLPFTNSIGVFDAHTGEYRESILTPGIAALSDGSIDIDDTGTQIFIVTASGLTVVKMDKLPLAIGSVTGSGGSWTITGTGFSAGTTVTVDGAAVSTEYVDAQHLAVSEAPALSSAHTVELTNPDGHSYTYDAAYLR
jgi:YVTN family beta-propeller protein